MLVVYAGGMFAFPSNNAVNVLFDTRRDPESALALERLADLERKMELEDYRTVSTDRGPVRGFPGGAGKVG